MPHRLLLVTIAVVAGAILSAQPPPLTVRITSPVDDGYASGLFRLVAVIEPAPAAKQVKELVFFADGKKVCTLTRLPFQCDWDAGDRLSRAYDQGHGRARRADEPPRPCTPRA